MARINGKVNLKHQFDQEERMALMTQKYQDKLDAKQLKNSKNGPYETIKIIQKNLISDFDEIIAEKRIYTYLLYTEIKSPLYHIEKLSELVGKAKAIIKSKVYKVDRRSALQKAIDIFSKVKDRLSLGLLDELKNTSYRRQISETPSKYDDSLRLERNSSVQEDFKCHIQDSINITRKRLGNNMTEILSEPSDKSGPDSEDEMDYSGNVWSRNRLSSTSTHSFQATQENTYEPWKNCGTSKKLRRATPCISPPLPRVTPLYLAKPPEFSARSCISPPLLGATPLYSKCKDPFVPQKSSDPEPPQPEKSTINEGLINGYYPTPNVHLDEIESIQATLKGLGNFENYDGKSSDSSDSGIRHYYYVDGELTEFEHPKSKTKPNQSIDSTEASKSGSDDWNFLKLTEENLAKFEIMYKPVKKLVDQKVSKLFLDDLEKKLKLISKKVEATKRKIGDVEGKKEDPRNPKKNKVETKKVKKIKLIREKKLYVKESPEIYKIVKKYK